MGITLFLTCPRYKYQELMIRFRPTDHNIMIRLEILWLLTLSSTKYSVLPTFFFLKKKSTGIDCCYGVDI